METNFTGNGLLLTLSYVNFLKAEEMFESINGCFIWMEELDALDCFWEEKTPPQQAWTCFV